MLQALLVDDEDMARWRLKTLLVECLDAEGVPLAHVKGELSDAQQALEWLAEHTVDVVIVDINMPGLNGMAFAKLVRQVPKAPLVIFVTAHDQYALEAFEVEAVDYLTKPVKRERLKSALERAVQRRGTSGHSQPGQTPTGLDGHLVVTERGRIERVALREVLYLKAELKYVTLRTQSKSYVLDDSLLELEQRLGDLVLRVHRNALVMKHAIKALERRHIHNPVDDSESDETWAVRMSTIDEWIQVSRRQLAAVRDAFIKNSV